MWQKICILIGIGFLYPGWGCAQSTPSDYAITKNALQTHVAFLSSDALEGRLTGTRGEKLATQYVADLFQQLGLEPAGDNGTFFQEFDFSSSVALRKINGMTKKQRGRNVLARLRVGTVKTSILMIGAHVDHLGRGEFSNTRSRKDEVNLIHNGADDNASGVASVLEAAVMLSHLQTQGRLHGNNDILFVIWSGEELGLLGSSHFIKTFIEKAENKSLRPVINAYINLDMVGRFRNSLILQGVGSSSNWPKLIEQANQSHVIPLTMQKDPYLPTDSTSFYLHGVPTLNLFTGAHDEYHTPRDKLAILNFTGMKSISTFLVDLILALEAEPQLMDYQQAQKTHIHLGRGYRVYLGTIPDYTSADLVGVKLSGVIKSSPAERAGLRQDDVIVELAGKKIQDIYDYSFALHGLHAGEPVVLVVLRGQQRLTLTIVAQSRV